MIQSLLAGTTEETTSDVTGIDATFDALFIQFASDECRSCDTLQESCQNYEETMALLECPVEDPEKTTEDTTEEATEDSAAAFDLNSVSDFVLGSSIVVISTAITFILLIRG